jgi:hypothetical protein
MKFEKISDDKFAKFEKHVVKNLNTLLGGIDTSVHYVGSDTGTATAGTWVADNVKTTVTATGAVIND